MRRIVAVILFMGLLFSIAVPAFAAEETDYDVLFDGADESGREPLMDALVEDPAAFLEALAFQKQETQHIVIYTMAREASIDEWPVVRYLIAWATDGRELTKSEKNTVDALRYAIDYADYSFQRAYKSGEELDAILKDAIKADGWYAEQLSSEYAEAIKGDVKGFLSCLAAQEEAVQQSVVSLMSIHCYWTMGNVLQDILNGVDKAALTDAEAKAVDALLAELNETPAPVVAVDPDSEELAAYLAKRQPAQPEPTQPEMTQAPTEAPVPTGPKPSQEGISGWWLVLVPLGVAVGYVAGAGRKKKE